MDLQNKITIVSGFHSYQGPFRLLQRVMHRRDVLGKLGLVGQGGNLELSENASYIIYAGGSSYYPKQN